MTFIHRHIAIIRDRCPALVNLQHHLKTPRDALFIARQSDDNDASRIAAGFFDKIQPLRKIEDFMNSMVKQYPSICRYKSLGRTHEGRNISMISISNQNNNLNKKIIFVQAGLHPREWIAPSTALYFAKAVLVNFNNLTRYLNDIELNIVPVANPDGYRYTFTADRLWRKNRQPNKNSDCIGVDLNRNYGFHWRETGTSSNPCDSIYGGDSPFSALETLNLSRYLKAQHRRLRAFVDLHSYGSYLFYPFGHKANTYYRIKEQRALASQIAANIKRIRGTVYQRGTPANLIYESAGGSDDYAAGILGVPNVFTLELPHDNFYVKNSDIRPIGLETSAGLLTLIKAVHRGH